MKLVDLSITIEELRSMAELFFGDLVKAVVDIKKEIMVVDAELHADQEQWMIENGSEQKDLWGINLYPFNKKEDMIEFDSMINLRPWAGNRKREVEDPLIRKKLSDIVHRLVKN